MIMFAIYLAHGNTPGEAFEYAGLEAKIRHDGERLLSDRERIEMQAEEIASSQRMKALMVALQTDPKLLLRQHLSALVLSNLDLALNGKKELVRLKAIQACLSRGGLPVESMQYHGTGKDLQKASSEELLARVKAIYEALTPAPLPANVKKIKG